MHALAHKLFSVCAKINRSINKAVYKHPCLQPGFGSVRKPGHCRANGKFSNTGTGRDRQRQGVPAQALPPCQPPPSCWVIPRWVRLEQLCHP